MSKCHHLVGTHAAMALSSRAQRGSPEQAGEPPGRWPSHGLLRAWALRACRSTIVSPKKRQPLSTALPKTLSLWAGTGVMGVRPVALRRRSAVATCAATPNT